MARSTPLLSLVPIVQGVFYIVGGLWPLINMSSFLAVTGPKADLWLVKTVGLLLLVIGLSLLFAGLRRRITPEIVILGVGTALAVAVIDIYYAAIDRISAIYLLDGLAELAIVAGWAVGGRRRSAPSFDNVRGSP